MRPPILLDLPEMLETERLLVRCPLPGDGRAVNEAVRESLEDLRPWMPWARSLPSVEESDEYVRRARARWLERTDLALLLFLRESGQFVGGSGLHRIDWEVPRFEIGYWCRTSLQGRGLITEAVRGITRFAFQELGAGRVEIRCDSRNLRSARVAERCGYALEAILRNHARSADGSLRDTLLYARVAGGD